ncbi:MAG: winged helix-turn-helix transcriptional regulator, partial [Candidatus Thorarchaeota archaeon]
LKFTFIIFSLFLLSIILFLLNELSRTFFGPNRIITTGIVTISLLIAIVLLLSVFEVLTIKDYKSHFLRKKFIQTENSYLTLEDIFENENRIKILKQILNNPGIHHNELLRSCQLQKGQLQWHLDVLLRNHIIKKERYGQFTLYFPITSSSGSVDKLKSSLSKSKTTSQILTLIQSNPGINSSEISRVLNLSSSTIKYHIDKLSEENLILLKRKGHKIEIFPI